MKGKHPRQILYTRREREERERGGDRALHHQQSKIRRRSSLLSSATIGNTYKIILPSQSTKRAIHAAKQFRTQDKPPGLQIGRQQQTPVETPTNCIDQQSISRPASQRRRKVIIFRIKSSKERDEAPRLGDQTRKKKTNEQTEEREGKRMGGFPRERQPSN